MLEKFSVGLLGMALLSGPVFADVGFDSDTSGWSLSNPQATLSVQTNVTVGVSDVYSLDYPTVTYTAHLLPQVGSGFGYLVMPEVASTGALATDSASSVYTFASATSEASTLWVRLVTADGAYYNPFGANDGFTVTLSGAYGARTYSVALESEAGGGVNATHISGDRNETLVGANQNGADTGWLSFGVLAGTMSIGVEATNVYDDAGHNAPVLAIDYADHVTAVPEPPISTLMLAGLVVAATVARRHVRPSHRTKG